MTHDTLEIWILGLTFFENYYIIFDQEDLRLGFATSLLAQDNLESLTEQSLRAYEERRPVINYKYLTYAIYAILILSVWYNLCKYKDIYVGEVVIVNDYYYLTVSEF